VWVAGVEEFIDADRPAGATARATKLNALHSR
jgi:hypothetical protein